MYRIRRLRQGIEYTGDSYDCTDSVCGSIYVLERLDDLNDQVELSNILESISAWGTPEYILMHELYSEPSCSSAGIIRLMLGLPHQIAIGRTPAGGN
jgi:hypothetical protein